MIEKILYVSLILFLILFTSNIAYATDVVMNLSPNANSTNTSEEMNETSSDYVYTESIVADDYEDSSELSISNMINIILIVVGIVLILLGIAIIIKLK